MLNREYPFYPPFIFLIVIFVVAPVGAFAQQTATIKGRVIRTDHNGIPNINVGLQGTKRGTASGMNGHFEIRNVLAGNYTLVAAGVGYKTVRRSVTLEAGQVLRLTIHLSKSTQQLSTIYVQGTKRNPFSESKSVSVAKIPVKRINYPQAYTTIAHSLFTQQLSVNYEDLFKNISGTNIPSHTTHGRVDISTRGFEARSYTKDGVSGVTHTAIDPANIAKIEFIKGPSSTLYGSRLSSYGGIINIITKKPYASFGGHVAYTGGSFGLNRMAFDLNTPVNKKHTILFRIDGSGTHKNSYMDAGYQKSVFVAPDLIWKINDRLNFEIQGEYYNRKATGDLYFSPQNTDINHIGGLDFNFHNSFNPNEIPYTAKQVDLHATLKETLSGNWTGRTDIVSTNNLDGGYKLHFYGISDTKLVPHVEHDPSRYSTIEAQQNFNSDYTFGRFRNKVLIGLDFFHYNTNEKESKFKADPINFVRPENNYDELTEELISRQLLNAEQSNRTTIQNTYAAYGTDIITFNKRWTGMANLRADRFQSRGTHNLKTGEIKGKFGQTALSTKLGLLYHPVVDKISIYGNYMTGFQNVNGANYEGTTFGPQRARQLAAGVKFKLFNHRLSARITYYNIYITNILRDDPNHPNYKQQSGDRLSRGIEFRTTANPLPGLNILAGYAFNLNKFKNISRLMNGRRDPHSGSPHTANLWVSYRMMKGPADGLGFGFGGNYGSRNSEIKHVPAHPFYRPAYIVIDAAVFYRHDFYRLGLKLNNLNNERYWTNRLALKEPRSISGRITIYF
jgi:iron complex outermembrane receptor protein